MKKGFTLIELLAVILILGIIALIAIPTVTSIIEDSKRAAFIRTSETIMNEIETECNLKKIKGEDHKIVYNFDNERTSKIGVKGKLPSSGGVMIVDDECTVSANFNDGKYCVIGSNKSSEVIVGELIDNKCIVKEVNTPSCTNSDANPGAFDEAGTLEDPYLIESIEDLYSIKLMDTVDTQDKHFKLAVDLDFKDDCSYANPSNKTYNDINKDNKIEGMKEEVNKGQGFKYRGNNWPKFAGNFDGNNKTIRNLYISGVGYDGYAGLFERVQNTTNPVYFKNLTLENINIEKMKDYVGGLIGSIEANTKVNISNINVSGYIYSITNSGGVIGVSSSIVGSTFDNIKFNGTLRCTGQFCGGILGTQNKTINAEGDFLLMSNITSIISSNCYGICGLIIGQASGIGMENIYTYGKMSNIELSDGYNQGYFGSIAGKLSTYGSTEIRNIYNYAEIKLNKQVGEIGGLFGQLSTSNTEPAQINKLKVINAYNYGNLDVGNTPGRVGGIAGNLYRVECTNCFNYGNINSNSKAVTIHGIFGQGSDNELINCTNFGTVNMPE